MYDKQRYTSSVYEVLLHIHTTKLLYDYLLKLNTLLNKHLHIYLVIARNVLTSNATNQYLVNI